MPTIQTLEIREDYAKFVMEPLERGFGTTLGNSLRRVLLSSIQGAAVTAIRIDKVFHEFQAIPGVKEDTTEFLLNLKDLAIRVDFDGAPPEDLVLRIDARGPGRVTGADVICPEGVEIVNPDCYLATLNTQHDHLGVELFVGWGSGYVLPNQQEKHKGIIGVIPFGSQFTPVKKVNWIVEQTRVMTRSDFERLVLEVWTNGTVAPNDAVTQAAHILDKFFRMFFDLGQAGAEPPEILDAEIAPELAHVPDIRIEELDFSQRTFNCLRRAGILNLRQLAGVSEGDLIGIRGFGKKSLGEVRDKLEEHGVELKPSKGGFSAFDLADDDDY